MAGDGDDRHRRAHLPEVVEGARSSAELVRLVDATSTRSTPPLGQPVHHSLRVTENGYGFDEIHAHRVARPPVRASRSDIRLEILTLSRSGHREPEFSVRARAGGLAEPDALPDLGWGGRGARLHRGYESAPR
jgi:hypothetical protein